MGELDKYMILLRREFTRSQARLARAERQREQLLRENLSLHRRLAELEAKAKRKRKPSSK